MYFTCNTKESWYLKTTILYGQLLLPNFSKLGVDEQLILEKTGHQSLEGVRSHKHTDTEPQENISIFSLSKKQALKSTGPALAVASI